MIFCRFLSEGEPRYGMVERHHIVEITPNPFSDFEQVGEPVAFNETQFLAPVIPSKIIAIGVNYPDHAKEMGRTPPPEPLFFLKPPSAVIGTQDVIRIPKMSSRVE